METFDEALVQRGSMVLWRRLSFLERFIPVVEGVFNELTGGSHTLGLRYDGLVSELSDEEAIREAFRERLVRRSALIRGAGTRRRVPTSTTS